ncbi:hypothetical protein PAXINDRAFT_13267 [Paxillus involutus ATCC 200175]|uniref:Uncharacterized protein n=1 Tax=Paxillus involutus ATCC 200175 TaxID=664439 RepID=A0A0C9TUL9_PAXIN|nr:hypothetical protein PAXINDRAFT_13267 [Paxillus involutus ATCC 200175]
MDDHNDQPTPRGPVGTPDGNSRCPNRPTEPPDEEKGARRGNSEMKVNKTVEMVEEVEMEESSRDDEQTKSKEVKGEAGDQNGEDDCQPDGRTNGTGDATNSVKASSGTWQQVGNGPQLSFLIMDGTAAEGSAKKSKYKNSDLPPGATTGNKWHGVLIPTYTKWNSMLNICWGAKNSQEIEVLQLLWDVVYKCTIPAMIQGNNLIYTVATQRIAEWRGGFASASISMIHSLINSDERFSSPQGQRDLTNFWLEGNQFLFADVAGNTVWVKRTFVLLQDNALTFKIIPPSGKGKKKAAGNERWKVNISGDMFKKDFWGHEMARFMDSIEAIPPKVWDKIITAAHQFVKETMWKGHGASSDNEDDSTNDPGIGGGNDEDEYTDLMTYQRRDDEASGHVQRSAERLKRKGSRGGMKMSVCHAYVIPNTTLPPPPDEPASKPPLSGYINEMATHLEHPRQESSTMQPRRTPYDETSNGEGGGEAASGDNEVEGKARDKARDDEKGQETREVKGMPNEGEERGMSVQAPTATNANGHSQCTPNEGNLPPSPPPPPLHHPPPSPSTPNHPERRDGDVNTAKSNKTTAQRRADALHDPGGETTSPGNRPPSVRLKGERDEPTSLHIEPMDV